MNDKAMRLLEFDVIRDALSRETETIRGKELALELAPSGDQAVVAEWLSETGEAFRFLDKGGEIPLGGIRDLRRILTKAKVEAVLLPEELLSVEETLVGFHRLKQALESQQDYPHLAGIAGTVEPQPQLARELRRCLTDDGEVADGASAKLGSLRNQIRTLQNRIREKMEEMTRSSDLRKYLQEGLITLRNGRYVLPVRAEYRAQVPGVIHDASASGATLFVEPMMAVEINNRLREVASQEREEVERILRELTRMVGQAAESLEQSSAATARLDLWGAKARLAIKMKAVPPEIVPQHVFRLKGARHPLLVGKVVPVDIEVGKDFDLLVITGPNTGGKTVALKTAGLLTLMAQSGLFVSAYEASMPVFRSVLVDIGDEQSIAQNLSTFSAHMANVISIIQAANRDSLVLLDELGAGTDPVEGAALGRSILEELRERRVLTVATTHYSELKVYAAETPRVSNASVEFDAVTLQPTYRLIIGLPGQSNALQIARRLGLEEHILRRAQGFMGTHNVELEKLIHDLNEDRRRGEAARIQAEEDLRISNALRRDYEERAARLKADERDLLLETKRKLEEEFKQARQEVDRLLGELRAAGREEAEAKAAALRDRLKRLPGEMEGLEEDAAPVEPLPGDPIAPGDAVWIRELRQEGEVLSLDGSQAMVKVGMLKVNVPRSELAVLAGDGKGKKDGKHGQPKTEGGNSGLARGKARDISPEVQLLGLTVDEAEAVLEKYLDDVYLAGLSTVRVVHGKGTGALRQGVRAYLKRHPHVGAIRPGGPTEGGDGVTVVEMG